MVPPPYDPILLREHAYYDTGDLTVVLDPDTFYQNGLKSSARYGLGFLNYNFGLRDEIYEKSFWMLVRIHVYTHFTFYLTLFTGLLFAWVYMNFLRGNTQNLKQLLFGKRKQQAIWKYKSIKNKNELLHDGDLEYQHVKD
ncbi:hypothetical protein TPHA_0B04560 [Tetrapisispora phaffii CBS 4417]|uniref:Uncharacterized protein n=1 Tax=Tetrapisispora phaffii (strain ATCC 24235 / CBS 4417 / NBRC 1672 / NRRL Y-8282 / UCD 70-5) TaxID=1071381 RepID=G8BQ44_TETPH|nr:hypothetical protein TPHA_0B04560 [Tetrapisispora phaffii CBS 4417]CCE62125.1 hypothetical protein TPHA_0B04560 [Tetrapisispora phaffii CBS 4417]